MAVIWLLLSSPALFSRGPGDRGLLLGFNTSSFTGSESTIENNSYIPGLTIGFFQEFEIGPHMIIGPEIAFTTKGSRLQTVGDLYLHQVITYMELPLLVNWIVNPGKRSRAFLVGGPTFSYMLLAFNEVGFPEEVSRFDFGASLGMGVRWRKIRCRIHMNQGLIDVDKSNSLTSVKNRTFNFTVGLSF